MTWFIRSVMSVLVSSEGFTIFNINDLYPNYQVVYISDFICLGQSIFIPFKLCTFKIFPWWLFQTIFVLSPTTSWLVLTILFAILNTPQVLIILSFNIRKPVFLFFTFGMMNTFLGLSFCFKVFFLFVFSFSVSPCLVYLINTIIPPSCHYVCL